jgi:hypothetical protein
VITDARDYDAMVEKLNGAAAQPPDDAAQVRIRCGFEILENPMPSRWLLRPYLEEAVLGLLYGDLGTLKSFIALDWSLRLATAGTAALYLSAEGRGLEKRIRGWCQRRFPDKKPEATMMEATFYAIEHPMALSQVQAITALEAAIEEKATPPKLIVVDTLARYGGALDENRAQDIAVLIAAGDRLRIKYGATVLFVHHVGHSAKDRARGSYALMAATDAHFLVERPDPAQLLVTVTTGRLKDSESPPPFSLKAEVIDLGYTDEDGQRVTTLALNDTDQAVLPAKRPPSGKQQGKLLRLLETEFTSGNRFWSDGELRRLAREKLEMHRNTARDAVLSLHQAGYLKSSIGGMTLVNAPGANNG